MYDSTIIEYYRKRVAEYDDMYGPPEIQEDLDWLKRWLQKNVAKSDILEVACGTGHWTKIASATARRIVATDINRNLLQAARHKVEGRAVDFVVAVAFKLPVTSNTFDCGMAHFWLSHVRRSDIPSFVSGFSRHFKSPSRLFFIDTKWVEGYRKPIVRRDRDGNTYQSFGVVQVQELSYLWAICVELD